MFDQDYFRFHHQKQIEQLGSARGIVTLHSGIEFKVQRIDDALPNYVLLTVYPDDGVSDETRKLHRKPGSDEICWDKVALSYSAIAYVRLTVTDPERWPAIGFVDERP